MAGQATYHQALELHETVGKFCESSQFITMNCHIMHY